MTFSEYPVETNLGLSLPRMISLEQISLIPRLSPVPTQPLSTSQHPLRKADNYPIPNTIINVLNLSNIMTWP